MIKGIHHIALKCNDAEHFARTVAFYRDTLGLTVTREWDAGVMIDTGAGVLEIFSEGGEAPQVGAVRHFALACDDVDACIRAVEAAGYTVTMPPKDIVIASEPPYPARIAFCCGPVGEELEFFCEK